MLNNTLKRKNRLEKTVRNIGFLGYGNHIASKNNKGYVLWTQIFNRCYSPILHKNRPNYINCSVDERWHCFQDFCDWYIINYKDNFYLDKDILVKENKIYGPDTCCFVPNEINTVFSNRKAKRGKLPIGVIEIIKNNKSFFRGQLTKNNFHYFYDFCETPEEAFLSYKQEKEKYIKELAYKWKDSISIKLYEVLINYEILITD